MVCHTGKHPYQMKNTRKTLMISLKSQRKKINQNLRRVKVKQMINEKALIVLKKRYTKRIRQMTYRYQEITRDAPHWVMDDIAPNFRKSIDIEHAKLRWIEERLKEYDISSN